jgi:hypothetical protein
MKMKETISIEEIYVKILLNEEINWTQIAANYNLTEEFIREFADKVDWACICMYQKLSEDFIREFQDKVHWDRICSNQKFSESFIREFEKEVKPYFYFISLYQELTEDFIREYTDKVNWSWIRYEHLNKLSPEFKEKFKKELDLDYTSNNLNKE